MHRLLPLLALLGAGALAAAGCASRSSGGSSQAAAAPKGATVIKMANIAFSPQDATVRVGRPVTWQNLDDVSHNVVADSGARFRSPLIPAGGTYAFTPTKPGVIRYECTLHPGMDATLKVVR